MRFRMTPREDSFFELFAAQAQHLEKGANHLAELLGTSPESRGSVADQLHDAEQAADEAAHSIRRRLSSVFITPFDRDDIYELSQRLDDCMDHMEEAGDLILVYGYTDVSPDLVQFVELLQRGAELTSQAIATMPRWGELHDVIVEINRVENQARKLLRRLNAALFETTTDTVTIFKHRDLFSSLESVAKGFEVVAQTIEAISVKEN
ncbi:DUF47 family protein [Micrococcales bacterium 31B]|nr:DUF47 family protein [Micrococcales bacterium 31B]